MDPNQYNQIAWDRIAKDQRQWFVPPTPERIAAAGRGEILIRLTATKNVPADWFGPVEKLANLKVLCLAAGGGHQGPLLAAAGADVTVVDFSEGQLEIDRQVASEHDLTLKTLQRDMRDLGDIGPFDMIINPCSVNFCDQVERVWQEAFRVLSPGGVFMAGLINPINYLFDDEEMLSGKFVVKNSIPFHSNSAELIDVQDEDVPPVPAEFGHSLEQLISGQLKAGFLLTDFYEDRWGAGDLLSERISVFMATRCIKPGK